MNLENSTGGPPQLGGEDCDNLPIDMRARPQVCARGHPMASPACGGYNYHQSHGHQDHHMLGFSINKLKIATTTIAMARREIEENMIMEKTKKDGKEGI
ncbi:hypothetical protein Acr_06g0014140 [Actinidia rufa]|uniref:Uncharacterized protein n=1 Tax=Actinidia rufa TaxID=165716 RepID=A0A7J0ESL3_9ERIC|nr:hypothetical protein Acr_06g0014140 [Actinidia rufa]